MARVVSFRDLRVYQDAIGGVSEVMRLTQEFPRIEKRRLSDQMIRASGAGCALIAEGVRRPRYRGAFINKLNEAEAEACEVQARLDVAVLACYLPIEEKTPLDERYERIQRQLVVMISQVDKWLIPAHRDDA